MSPCYLGGKYHCRLHPGWRKCACQFFRETEHVKSNLPDRCHLLPIATTKLIMGVFKSWISDAHCPFQWKWQVLHNYDISLLQQVGMFSMGSPAWWRFGLWSSGNSFMSRWRDAPLTRNFQMWRRRCKQIDPHWFQGRQTSIWCMWSHF